MAGLHLDGLGAHALRHEALDLGELTGVPNRSPLPWSQHQDAPRGARHHAPDGLTGTSDARHPSRRRQRRNRLIPRTTSRSRAARVLPRDERSCFCETDRCKTEQPHATMTVTKFFPRGALVDDPGAPPRGNQRRRCTRWDAPRWMVFPSTAPGGTRAGASDGERMRSVYAPAAP
jgi:hypothetical protein